MFIQTNQIVLFLTFFILVVNCSPISVRDSNEAIKQESENQEGKLFKRQEYSYSEMTTRDQEPVKEPAKDAPSQEPIEKIVQEVQKEQIENKPAEQTVEQTPEEEVPQTTCHTSENCSTNSNHRLSNTIALTGNVVAAAATAKVASPILLKSAKVATFFALLPIKLAAKGAVIGTVIAKPFIIKSALVGAKATKIAYAIVGKPISVAANALASAEALRENIMG